MLATDEVLIAEQEHLASGIESTVDREARDSFKCNGQWAMCNGQCAVGNVQWAMGIR